MKKEELPDTIDWVMLIIGTTFVFCAFLLDFLWKSLGQTIAFYWASSLVLCTLFGLIGIVSLFFPKRTICWFSHWINFANNTLNQLVKGTTKAISYYDMSLVPYMRILGIILLIGAIVGGGLSLYRIIQHPECLYIICDATIAF